MTAGGLALMVTTVSQGYSFSQSFFIPFSGNSFGAGTVMNREGQKSDASMLRKLAGIRHVALDLDGTIYAGDTLFWDTLPFSDPLQNIGLGCTFLTNNPSKNHSDYQAGIWP